METLSNIRELGCFKNTLMGSKYNLKKGRNKQRGIDKIFYTYRGKRVFVSDKEFYENHIKIN